MTELTPAVPADLQASTVLGGRAITERRPKPFQPNKKQHAYLDAWTDPTAPKTVIGIAKHIGMSRAAIHLWQRSPEFTAWFNSECRRRTDHLWEPILAKTSHLALQGSPEHIKLIGQIRGELGHGESSAGANVGVTVVVGVPRPGDHVDVPRETVRIGLPAARSEQEP